MANIVGSNSSETILGTVSPDTINSLGGSDRVSASAGADTLSGGDGSDLISGGAGNDVIYGHSAADLNENSGAIRSTLLTNVGQGAVFFTTAPGDEGHGYAVNKNSGQITRIDTETGLSTTFLDTPDGEFSATGEGGVLGLAFHPDYESNGRFFIFRTDSAGDIEILEYRRSSDNPALADPMPVQTILTIPHPTFTNHNGGFIGFGPDRYLYATVGDGGAANDPEGDAQNLNSLLGKVLRIDVNGDDFLADPQRNYAIPDDNPFVGAPGADEIWAYGLRNPWRMSFDSATGDVYIADVGQARREEINFEPASSSGGLNYGWNHREGTIEGPAQPSPIDLTDPVFDYPHFSVSTPSGTEMRGSVTGGYVYHGPAAGLQGAYFFADFTTDRLFTLRMVDGVAEDAIERTAQITGDVFGLVTSFGTDGDGNLYAVSFTGGIYRLDPSVAAGDGHDRLRGDGGDDALHGGVGNDFLDGGADNDALFGGRGHDLLFGGLSADTMRGGLGNDTYHVDDAGDRVIETSGQGHDVVRASVSFALSNGLEDLFLAGSASIAGIGNALANRLVGNDGNNRLDGRAGADVMVGGLGADLYIIDSAADRAVERPGEGTDTAVSFVSFALGANLEILRLAGTAGVNGTGNALGNLLAGNGGANRLAGGDGHDRLVGGGGGDILLGGEGTDVLIGGAGADRFVFQAITDFAGLRADADLIADFDGATADRIVLAGIDADSMVEGNQAFAFVGRAAFSHSAGELRFGGDDSAAYVLGDTDGDGAADFMIRLAGQHELTASDFVL